MALAAGTCTFGVAFYALDGMIPHDHAIFHILERSCGANNIRYDEKIKKERPFGLSLKYAELNLSFIYFLHAELRRMPHDGLPCP